MFIKFVLAALVVASVLADRVILEEDITTFSSKYWKSERLAGDSDILKVKIKFY